MTGRDIQQWRARLGLSQSEAAKRLKTSVRTLQGWELGRTIHPLMQRLLKPRITASSKR